MVGFARGAPGGVERGSETFNPLEGNLMGEAERWDEPEEPVGNTTSFESFDLKQDGSSLPVLEIEGAGLGFELEDGGAGLHSAKRRVKIRVLAMLCAAVSVLVVLAAVLGTAPPVAHTTDEAEHDSAIPGLSPEGVPAPAPAPTLAPAMEPAPGSVKPGQGAPTTPVAEPSPAAEPARAALEPSAEPEAEPEGGSEPTRCRDFNTECPALVRAFGCERSLMPVMQGTGADICPDTCHTCQSSTRPALPPAPPSAPPSPVRPPPPASPPPAPPPPPETHEHKPQHQCQEGYELDHSGECMPMGCQQSASIEHAEGTVACNGVFGDPCPYSCEAGFEASGRHICGADGMFHGGSCQPRTCTAGLEIPHSNRVGDNHCAGVVGDGCSYTCDDGYSGPNGRKHFETMCESSGSFQDGACMPVQCGPTVSGLDEHATASCVGETQYDGDPCLATCNEGYRGGELAATYTCGADGEWTIREDEPALVCTPNACGSTGSSIEHSQTVCDGVTGDQCEFTCEDGYLASGVHVCGANGEFAGGSCEPLPCDQGTMIPNSNRDKRHDNPCEGVTGDRCLYTCNDGFAPVGEMVCGSDGHFRGGRCDSVECSATSEMPNAQTDCGADVAHLGDQCTARCQPGFFPTDEERTFECLEDGTWSEEPLVCSDINECRDAGDDAILHQCHPHEPCINTVGGFTCGDCEAGYHGDGAGGCIINACTAGTTIANSDRTAANPCTGSFGEHCVYHCNTGYVRGPSEHICGAHQHFSGGMCVAVACTQGLTIPHSNRDDQHPCDGSTGDTCEYTCVDGYVQIGNHTCGADGAYTGGGCAPIDCGAAVFGLPDHASAVCTGSTLYGGDPCLATCDEGYRADATSIAASFECDASGVWTGQTQLNCEPETCEATRFTHALDDCVGQTGDICNFHCEPGFSPDGLSSCGSDNRFTARSCVPSVCADSFIAHSNRQQGNPCSGHTGSLCDYHCDDGYQKSGDHICGISGSFSGGSCSAVVCQPFEEPAQSQAQCEGPHTSDGRMLMGATCSAQCAAGFAGAGSGVFSCDADGAWRQPENADLLVCSDVDECEDSTICGKHQVCTNSQGSFTCGSCPEGSRSDEAGGCRPVLCQDSVLIPNADAASIDACTAEFGDACTFSCNEGFSPGPAAHICQANGEFSGGSCIANECTRGGTVANSNRHSSRPCTGSTGDSCDYECYNSYTGSGQLVCQPDGQWSAGQCVRETCAPLSQSGTEHTSVTDCSDGTTVDPHVVGTSCNLECLPGYHAGTALQETFSCDSTGNWAGDLVCVAEPCVPSSLDHTADVCEGSTGDVCTYNCDEGYTPIARDHTCGVDHQFSGGQCLPQICSSGLTIPNSDRTDRNPCVGATGMPCVFECNDGYVAVGSHVCSTTGRFVGGSCVESRSECDPISTLFDEKHHVVEMTCHTAIGSQCLVICQPGYHRRGTGAFVCEEGGQWSGSLRCELAEPEPEPVEGYVPEPEPEPEPDVCSNSGGDENCETYISLGQTCAGTFCPDCGVASGLCDEMCKFCTPPPPPKVCSPNGPRSADAVLDHVDIRGASCTTAPRHDGSVVVGTSCTVSCGAGYSGNDGEIMCGNDEQWHGSVYCVPACPDINTLFEPYTDHILYATCDTSPGTTCTVECDSFGGYEAEEGSSGIYVCDDSGTWQGSLICQAAAAVPTPEPADVEVGEEFDPAECFVGEYSESRCCDLRMGPTGDTDCWTEPPFVFEECCVNYLDRLGCINRASDAQCTLWLAGGAGNPVFSCALNFCPDCGDEAGLCDLACGYCTPEVTVPTVELACMDTSTECVYQAAALGCDHYLEGGLLEHMCDASCGLCQQGDATCFDSEFTYERCCNTLLGEQGDTNCWAGDFDFARCCATEALPPPPPLMMNCSNVLDSMLNQHGYCDQLIGSGHDGHTCDEAFCPTCDNAHTCDLTCNFCDEGGTIAVGDVPPPPPPASPPPPGEVAPCMDLNTHCTMLVNSFGCDQSLEPVLHGTGSEMCPHTCNACAQAEGLTPGPPPSPPPPTPPPAPPPPATGCSPITEYFNPDDHLLSLTACDTAIGTHCMVGCDMRNGYSSTGPPGMQYVCGPDGQWSGSLRCVGPPPPAPVVSCSAIADHFTADDHVVVRPCETSPGTTCMVSCDILDGYHAANGLPGAQFVCGPDGQWSGSLTCVGAPSPPPTGCSPIAEYLDPDDHLLALRACDTAIGSQCMVGCDMRNGYRSTGLPGVQYVCAPDGQWSGSLTCVGPNGGR